MNEINAHDPITAPRYSHHLLYAAPDWVASTFTTPDSYISGHSPTRLLKTQSLSPAHGNVYILSKSDSATVTPTALAAGNIRIKNPNSGAANTLLYR